MRCCCQLQHYADGRSNKDPADERTYMDLDEKQKFDEVCNYLLKGQYPAESSKSEKLVVRRYTAGTAQ